MMNKAQIYSDQREKINNSEDVKCLDHPFTMSCSTKRLSLREFAQDDRQALTSMHKQKAVKAQLIDDLPLEKPSCSYAFIERQREIYREFPGLGIWCAEHISTTLKEEDLKRSELQHLSEDTLNSFRKPRAKFAGWFSLMPIPNQLDQLEIGSRLLPKYWGGGLAVEGGELLVNHCFNTLDQETLWIACHTQHRSASCIAYILGFAKDKVDTYNQKTAQYYRLSKNHWREWQKLPRKERVKSGLQSIKEVL